MKNRLRISVFGGVLFFVILLIIDRLTKQFAVTQLKGNASRPIIGQLFVFQYLENTGAAFGLLQNRRFVFIIIAVVIVAVIAFFYMKIPHKRRYLILRILLVAIAAGAIGNLIDRVMHGYVVDFLYIQVIHFPIFNVADIYVTISVILLVLLVIFYLKEEDMSEIGDSLKRRRIKK